MRTNKIIALMLGGLTPCVALAEDSFQVQGSFGFQTKQVEVAFFGGQIKIKPTFQALNYALNMSYGRFFTNLETDVSIDGDTSYFGDTVHHTTLTLESSRTDSTVTAGYYVGAGVNLFAGYKTGETETHLSPVDGGVMRVSISEKGPFLGFAYGYSIGDAGVLAVSAAYAQLDGEAGVFFYGSGDGLTSGGETSGLSYGISWTGDISERTYYRLSLKINRFRFDDQDLGVEGKDWSTDEDYQIVGVTVGANF